MWDANKVIGIAGILGLVLTLTTVKLMTMSSIEFDAIRIRKWFRGELGMPTWGVKDEDRQYFAGKFIGEKDEDGYVKVSIPEFTEGDWH